MCRGEASHDGRRDCSEPLGVARLSFPPELVLSLSNATPFLIGNVISHIVRPEYQFIWYYAYVLLDRKSDFWIFWLGMDETRYLCPLRHLNSPIKALLKSHLCKKSHPTVVYLKNTTFQRKLLIRQAAALEWLLSSGSGQTPVRDLPTDFHFSRCIFLVGLAPF